MSKRIPPSAEQIEQALYDRLMELPAEHAYRALLSMDEAKRVLAAAFSTSHAKAYEWLLAIAASDAHPVEVLRVTNGSTYSVLRTRTKPGSALWRWANLSDENGHSVMTDTPRLKSLWGGIAVAEPAAGPHGIQTERPADKTEYVAVTKLFAPIVQEYVDQYQAKRVERETEKILEGASIEHEHGDALAYIRGLLDAVGATHPYDPDELLRVRYGRRAAVTISLVGDAIDKVGDALKTLGVQPKREDN